MQHKDKRPYNVNGQRHGLWEVYWSENGKLWYKGHYTQNQRIGFWESYHNKKKIKYIEFYAR